MLTPFQQQVKELVEQGKMLKDIAVELGYSVYQVQTCARQLRQKGILPEKPKRAEITPTQEKVLSLVKAGYTQSEIDPSRTRKCQKDKTMLGKSKQAKI